MRAIDGTAYFARDVSYEHKMFKNLTTDLTILIWKASGFPYSPQGMIKNQLTSVSISFLIDDCTTNIKEAAWAIKPTPGQERQFIFYAKRLYSWRHYIQHNDIQHDDTQHNNTQHNDTQHNTKKIGRSE